MRTVVVVNFQQRFVVCDDGLVLPITRFLDEFQDVTSDLRDAFAFVAGEGSCWFGGLVADWQPQTIH